MKKLKKLFAVMLSLIMVLAMGITSFADEAAPTAAKITVNNLDANATLTSVQIIAPDQKTETGWAFVNGADASFKKVFTGLEDQAIIWKLIKYADANSKVPSGTVAATAGEFQAAMQNVETDLKDSYSNTGVKNNEITVNNAGVYAVKATTTDTANYVYSPMAAYISFGEYTTVPTDLVGAEVNAKKVKITIEKTNNEADGVVEIGKEVEYTVRTNVPYITDDVAGEDVTYTITDTIEGANYKTNADGKVEVTVKIGAAEPTTSTVIPTSIQDEKKQIVIDLSTIAANRTNANAEVIITYKAIVTSEIVNNTVVPNDGTHQFTPVTNTLHTGKITITKTDDSEKNPVRLAKAGFVIYRTEGNKTLYALVSKDISKNNNEYVVTDWTGTLNDAKADTNLIMTDSNGEAVVRGLDDSYTYNFKEIKAPEGYSVNTTDSSATWGTNQEASNRTGTASMTDTKLSALPETGGIGTTIFTIVGCGIMIAAAGLFFASRRKENR